MPETIKQLEEIKVALSCAEVLEVTIKVQARKLKMSKKGCTKVKIFFLAIQEVSRGKRLSKVLREHISRSCTINNKGINSKML